MFIEAKESVYNGTCFRSMLEARWAIFFDALKVAWSYEPELCVCDGLQYLPDFWLMAYKSFVEIKPVVSFDGVEFDGFEKCTALARERPLVVLCGQPYPHGLSAFVRTNDRLRRVPGCEFGICPRCEAVLLCTPYTGRPGRTCWAPLLAPFSADAVCATLGHQFVHSPLDIIGADDDKVCMAKLKLMAAYDKVKSARNNRGSVYSRFGNLPAV